MGEELTGRTALITGAGRNIGRAVALALAAAGADVAVNVRTNRAEGEAVAEAARRYGVRAAVVPGDIGDPAAVADIVASTTRALAPVDILVNCAAIRPTGPFLDISIEEWDAVVANNLSACFYLSRLVLPSMIERGFGRLVFIGGPDATVGATIHVHSTAAKAGVLGFAKSLARAYGAAGVTANVLTPGWTDTERKPGYALPWPPPADYFVKEMHLPIPRLGRPEEIGDACVFLASPKGDFITGQTLNVSGGFVMS